MQLSYIIRDFFLLQSTSCREVLAATLLGLLESRQHRLSLGESDIKHSYIVKKKKKQIKSLKKVSLFCDIILYAKDFFYLLYTLKVNLHDISVFSFFLENRTMSPP